MRKYHIIQSCQQTWSICIEVKVQGRIDKHQPWWPRQVPFDEQGAEGSCEITSSRVPYDDDLLRINFIYLPEDKQSPHVGFKAVVQAIRERFLWCLTIIYRNDRNFELRGPRSSISLVNEGTHTDESTPMYMKDDSFRCCLLFLLKETTKTLHQILICSLTTALFCSFLLLGFFYTLVNFQSIWTVDSNSYCLIVWLLLPETL